MLNPPPPVDPLPRHRPSAGIPNVSAVQIAHGHPRIAGHELLSYSSLSEFRVVGICRFRQVLGHFRSVGRRQGRP
ncbi:hypothetical protein CEXT_648881 [Caerostris extrusa]|uniref:Uncharacterized protein n=1 Tax=Caerostris extrusa TaxID=172846 RepID=A0AAV4WGF4_CAEEX|nr:hypothetical protein CEXT_648881 [Caerostris extrusa]